MKLFITASIPAIALAAQMCDVPKGIKKDINRFVNRVYDNCPPNMTEEECDENKFMSDAMKQKVIEMIKSTGKIPCKMLDAIRSPKALNNLDDYNCDDKECDIAIDLRGIWGYGCWCHFGTKLTNGRGKPVSAHDKACQNMQLCLRCAEMDGGKDGYECDARTAQYNSTLGQSGGQNNNINSLNSQCSSLNPDDLCGAHVCTCEVQLINDILALVWEQEAYDIAPRHPSNPFGGSFDFEASCETNPGITEIDCCGKYPFRSTYNSLHRQCCLATEQLYNPFDTVCCQDGLYPIGNGGC